jgi:elongation factor Ts
MKLVLMLLQSKKEIAKDLLRQEGKPEAMLDNIAKGKFSFL